MSAVFRSKTAAFLGVALMIFLFGPYIASWKSPTAGDQYECKGGDPLDPRGARAAERATRRLQQGWIVDRIHLTDTGGLVNRCEWTAVLDEQLYGVRRDGKDVPQIVLLYIHGWRHNGAETNDDYKRFTDMVKRLADEETQSQLKRRVIGVYIGWDAATDVPLIEYLTFWGRQIAADRISQSGIVTKLLGAMESIRKIRNVEGDRIFYVAHSFGARILFASYAQVLLHQTQLSHPNPIEGERTYKLIKPPADVALLLNPAFEASMFTALDSVRRNREDVLYKERFSIEQDPLVVAITTSNDWATQFAFPAGQMLAFRRTQPEFTALGHYPKFRTHELVKDHSRGGAEEKRPGPDWAANFCVSEICLKRSDSAENNPFIVSSATPEVLNGHNGIWHDDFVKWMVAFLKQVDGRVASRERQTKTSN